jgi:hypothetical protein
MLRATLLLAFRSVVFAANVRDVHMRRRQLEKGVRVKMVTGDDTAIAIETARQLARLPMFGPFPWHSCQ